MNQLIELHDSEIAVMWFDQDSAIIIFSHAYIHRSEGRPAVDSGTGRTQRAELVIGGTEEVELPAAWPWIITDGSIELSGIIHDNALPIPLSHHGVVRLKLDGYAEGDEFRSIEIRGSGTKLTLLGEPRYVEVFAGAG